MHHLPPTAAAVLGWKLLGMPVRDPAASGGDGCPALDGQLRGGLAQRADDAGGRPVHRAVRRDAIDHQVVEHIRLDELRCQAPRLIHAPAPEAVAILAEQVAQRLGDMAGLAGWAALSLFEWEDGRSGHVLVLGKVPDRHRDAVAKAFAELFAFLPEIEGGLDLAFSDRAPAAGALVIEVPTPVEEAAPRRDPKAPPRLR